MKSTFEIQTNPTFFPKEIRKFASIPKNFFPLHNINTYYKTI